jgi:hypothetical protein
MTKLDLTKRLDMQDMLQIVMNKKGLSAREALEYSINEAIYNRVLDTGYASIALDLWGHGDPEREWLKLDNPRISIEFDESRQSLIDRIGVEEKVNTKTSIAYFLLYTMEALGYHI